MESPSTPTFRNRTDFQNHCKYNLPSPTRFSGTSHQGLWCDRPVPPRRQTVFRSVCHPSNRAEKQPSRRADQHPPDAARKGRNNRDQATTSARYTVSPARRARGLLLLAQGGFQRKSKGPIFSPAGYLHPKTGRQMRFPKLFPRKELCATRRGKYGPCLHKTHDPGSGTIVRDCRGQNHSTITHSARLSSLPLCANPPCAERAVAATSFARSQAVQTQ